MTILNACTKKIWKLIECTTSLDFGCFQDASLIPHIPVESTKGFTHFCKSGVHLVIYDNRLRGGATEVGELFYHFQSLSLDGDVGLDVWFSSCGLMHLFCLFCADGLAKIVTGHWELVNTVLNVGFGSSVQYTIIYEWNIYICIHSHTLIFFLHDKQKLSLFFAQTYPIFLNFNPYHKYLNV